MYILLDFFYLHPRIKGRRRERNLDVREKHRLVASYTCPDRESNPQPFGYGMTLQPTRSYQPGLYLISFISILWCSEYRSCMYFVRFLPKCFCCCCCLLFFIVIKHNIKFYHFNFLSVYFRGINYIYSVVQSSPLPHFQNFFINLNRTSISFKQLPCLPPLSPR